MDRPLILWNHRESRTKPRFLFLRGSPPLEVPRVSYKIDIPGPGTIGGAVNPIVEDNVVNRNPEVFSKVQGEPWSLFMVCVAQISRMTVGTVGDSINALVGAVALVVGAGHEGSDRAQLN